MESHSCQLKLLLPRQVLSRVVGIERTAPQERLYYSTEEC